MKNGIPSNMVMAFLLYRYAVEAYTEMIRDSHRRANDDHPVLSKKRERFEDRKQIFEICSALTWDWMFEHLGEQPSFLEFQEAVNED